MNPFQFDITSDDQPFYQIDINYTPATYKHMLDGVQLMLRKNFKRRFRILRALFWFSFVFLLATNIRFLIGDPMFFHKIIPGYNAMLPPILLVFLIGGFSLLILQISFLYELFKIKSPLRKGLIKDGETTRYTFYPQGFSFGEPHQRGALIWQALHYITIEDTCIGFGFCPPSTPKGKFTAKFRDIFIPVEQINDCDFVINAFEQLSHDQFKFIDSRSK